MKGASFMDFQTFIKSSLLEGKAIMYKINYLFRFLILAVMLFALPATEASAALLRCRTDPIFWLSNGDILIVALDIGTTEANISNVNYILSVPAGVTVKQVVYTDTSLGRKETYKVYQTSPAKTYTIDTVVTTVNSAGVVDVIVYTRLNGVYAKTISGYNGYHLLATLRKR
jgi:hypothetical protein